MAGLHAPEEMNGRHGPVGSILLDVIAQAGGVPMGEIVPAHHVRGRGVDPREPSHLEDHPAGPGRPIDHPVPSRHAAVRERLDPRGDRRQLAQERLARITPLERQVIAWRLGRVDPRLLELIPEDGFADRRLRAIV
jgi:hypothetical protein